MSCRNCCDTVPFCGAITKGQGGCDEALKDSSSERDGRKQLSEDLSCVPESRAGGLQVAATWRFTHANCKRGRSICKNVVKCTQGFEVQRSWRICQGRLCRILMLVVAALRWRRAEVVVPVVFVCNAMMMPVVAVQARGMLTLMVQMWLTHPTSHSCASRFTRRPLALLLLCPSTPIKFIILQIILPVSLTMAKVCI